MNWELIETHTQDGFTIKTYVAPEEMNPADQFDEEVVQGIRDGIYTWFTVKVEASKNGIVLADEYLGGCCYESETDFLDIDGYWADMCETALHDAKQTLKDLVEV